MPYKKYIPRVLIFSFYLIILLRYLIFVANYGGIEYDSGWFLSVARGLSERGTVATKVNPLLTENRISPSLWGRIGVQDKNGYVFLPAANSVGFGYFLPQSIILKVFGFGYWQARFWPIITSILLIFLLAYIAYKLGDFFAALIMAFVFWSFPQIFVNFFFEAFSEQTALLYMLFGIFVLSSVKDKVNIAKIILGGLLLGLAATTKILMIIFFPIIYLIFIVTLNNCSRFIKIVLLLVLIAFSLLPILGYESYKYWYISSQLGSDSYKAIQKDAQTHLSGSGSGMLMMREFMSKSGERTRLVNELRKDIGVKLWLWNELFGVDNISKYYFWIVIALIMPIVSYRFWRKNQLFLYLILVPFAQWVWFLILADTPWARYVFPSIIITYVTLSASIGIFISKFIQNTKDRNSLVAAAIIFSFIALPFFYHHKYVYPSLSIDWFNNLYTKTSISPLVGFPALSIFDLKQQKQAVEYITKNTSTNDKIIVDGEYIAPEIVALTNRSSLVVDRFINNYSKYKNNKNYLVLGPHLVGKYSRDKSFSKLAFVKSNYCGNESMQNDGYFVCRISNAKISLLINKQKN